MIRFLNLRFEFVHVGQLPPNMMVECRALVTIVYFVSFFLLARTNRRSRASKFASYFTRIRVHGVERTLVR